MIRDTICVVCHDNVIHHIEFHNGIGPINHISMGHDLYKSTEENCRKIVNTYREE